MDNRFNKVFSFFDSLNVEFSPGFRLIDVFSSCFSFHPYIKCKDNNLVDHVNQLNDIAITSLSNHSHTLIISDMGIKNNVAIFIAHIHIQNRLIIKTVYCVLWQPLDQRPITALQVNLKDRYLVENTSCVIHKRTRQETTTVFY